MYFIALSHYQSKNSLAKWSEALVWSALHQLLLKFEFNHGVFFFFTNSRVLLKFWLQISQFRTFSQTGDLVHPRLHFIYDLWDLVPFTCYCVLRSNLDLKVAILWSKFWWNWGRGFESQTFLVFFEPFLYFKILKITLY